MGRGLNHALQLAMSAAAGSAKLLGLDAARTADAIAASTVDNVSLAAVHTEPVSTWKGISPAITGMRAVYATMLAGRGITGPRAFVDGPNGLEQLFDQPIDLRPSDRSLNAVEQTYLKQYCSLIHGQVVIEPGTGRIVSMAVNRTYSLDLAENPQSSNPEAGPKVKANYPNTVLCSTLGASTSGFYEWRQRQSDPAARFRASLRDIARRRHQHGWRGPTGLQVHLRQRQSSGGRLSALLG